MSLPQLLPSIVYDDYFNVVMIYIFLMTTSAERRRYDKVVCQLDNYVTSISGDRTDCKCHMRDGCGVLYNYRDYFSDDFKYYGVIYDKTAVNSGYKLSKSYWYTGVTSELMRFVVLERLTKQLSNFPNAITAIVVEYNV
jgi:hypothetical protein